MVQIFELENGVATRRLVYLHLANPCGQVTTAIVSLARGYVVVNRGGGQQSEGTVNFGCAKSPPWLCKFQVKSTKCLRVRWSWARWSTCIEGFKHVLPIFQGRLCIVRDSRLCRAASESQGNWLHRQRIHLSFLVELMDGDSGWACGLCHRP